MMDAIHMWENLKLQNSHILGGICSLVRSLLLIDGAGKHKNITYPPGERVSEEVYHLDCFFNHVPELLSFCLLCLVCISGAFGIHNMHQVPLAAGFSITVAEMIDVMAK